MQNIPPFIIVSYLGAIALLVYPMILCYARKRQKSVDSQSTTQDEVDYIKQYEDSPEFPGYHL